LAARLDPAERGDAAEAKADLRRAIDLARTAEFAADLSALMAEYGLD
jgi:hypothetical protein